MSKSKRLNRDHAKRKQRPMVEDRVIAEHLTALLTPTIKSQSRFFRLLPNLNLRWSTRQNRPLPDSVQFTLSKFENIWCADGSTLEALFRKLKSLESVSPGTLAGKMGVVMDLVTRLPIAIWFKENPSASDTRFEDNLLELVSPQTLLLLDRGFYHFRFWQQLIEPGIHFITRIKINAVIEYQTIFTIAVGLKPCP